MAAAVRALGLPKLDKWYLGGGSGGTGSLCPRHGPWLAKNKRNDSQFFGVFHLFGGGISRERFRYFVLFSFFRWFVTHMSRVKILELSQERIGGNL